MRRASPKSTTSCVCLATTAQKELGIQSSVQRELTDLFQAQERKKETLALPASIAQVVSNALTSATRFLKFVSLASTVLEGVSFRFLARPATSAPAKLKTLFHVNLVSTVLATRRSRSSVPSELTALVELQSLFFAQLATSDLEVTKTTTCNPAANHVEEEPTLLRENLMFARIVNPVTFV